MQESNILEEALDILGEKAMVIAMEELSELIQAISKMIRGKENINNLVEEYADVLICLSLVSKYYNLDKSAIESVAEYKINRMKTRIENNELK